MIEDQLEFTKKDILMFAAKAVVLAVLLTGHFFMIQNRVSVLVEKMEKMEAIYEQIYSKQNNEKVLSETFRAKYGAQVESNTKRIEFLEAQVRDIRESNREILVILREMRRE